MDRLLNRGFFQTYSVSFGKGTRKRLCHFGYRFPVAGRQVLNFGHSVNWRDARIFCPETGNR
jgi:hypothetical protein